MPIEGVADATAEFPDKVIGKDGKKYAAIGLGVKENRSKDILGRVYEYFLGQFTSTEGKKGGQFYTARCIVRLLVTMLAPHDKARIYDPCCGSGGMFIQSEEFIEIHGGKRGAVSVYGQESNPTTWRLANMNMAIRHIEANLGSENAGIQHNTAAGCANDHGLGGWDHALNDSNCQAQKYYVLLHIHSF